MNRPSRSRPRRRAPQKLNFSPLILQFLQKRLATPATYEELIKALEISKKNLSLFQQSLNQLVEQGLLALKEGRYRILSPNPLVTGIISMHAKGFGFLKSSQGGPDIFIPKQYTQQAADGDTVEATITSTASPKGPEGEVVAILKRSRTHLACIVFLIEGTQILAYTHLLGRQVLVQTSDSLPEIREGDRIVCKVSAWDNTSKQIEATGLYRIGHISDPSTDISAAIEEYELPDGFSRETLDEAKTYGSQVLAKDQINRLDLTATECVTIDPKTARDFDDAISLTKDAKGHFLLGVHIADVAYYVRPGMHIDEEARLRCNSTYFPGQCIPMLPEALSNELCSLKPNVPRLTISVLAEFDPDGQLVDFQVRRTTICSSKRFSYEEAFAVLEGRETSPYLPLLQRMVELCHLLKKQRIERGSIDFTMAENQIVLNAGGQPIGIERIEYDITHQMIEEFMLKANELVAFHLDRLGKQLIFRVHEEPSEDSFHDFFTFARALGFPLPAQPTRQDLQHLFLKAKDSPLHPQLSVSFIRSLRLAIYSPENVGHYGLALEHYCHFTSPIRRYTDLIIQRLILDELPADENLRQIAQLCSEKERVSWKAEHSVRLLKKLRLAQASFTEDPGKEYVATITQVKPFALFFEVTAFDLEGSFHVSELGNDFFEYHPQRMLFRGVRTHKTFQLGQTFHVRLDQIDLIHQKVKWSQS